MKIKKAFSVILASCIITSAMSISGAYTVSSSAPIGSDNGIMRDNITVQQIADEMGVGLNLGNTMEAYWLDQYIRKGNWLNEGRIDSGAQTIGQNKPQNYETCWGAVVTTQEAIDGMKAAGFNTVRVPVYWGNMMNNDGTFTINDEYIGRVKEIVDYCRNAGLYVVINMHHYDEFLIRRYSEAGTLKECAETIKKLWTQIAEYFKDYSDYLVFEGFNEYLGGGPYERNSSGDVMTDQWGNPKVKNLPKSEAYEWTNTLNQTFVNAVRSTGGNNAKRILIASGYWTNIDNTTKSDFKMPNDTVENRMMVSVHYVDNGIYWSNQIGNDRWEEYSLDQLEKLNKAFTAKGIPVFIGETTGSYDGHFADNATYKESPKALDHMLRLIKSYGFVPVIWDTNDGFYSRTEYKIKSQKNEDVINKLSQELKDGTFKKIVEPSDTTQQNPSKKPSTNPTNSSEPTKTTVEPKSTNDVKTTAKPSTCEWNKKAAQKAMKQAKLTSLKVKSKAKKKINVTWKKVKKAKGYQIQVSTNKKFKKSKIIFKKDLKKTKFTIKNKKIKSRKTYYVRVRAYATYKNKNNDIKKVYSAWNKKLRKVTVK